MTRKQTFKAVILAGGSGERFWPLSTAEHPKQFLRVFGGESLIRQAVSRLAGLVAPADIFVITSKELVRTTRRELPEIPAANIVGEPMRRDTGAALATGVGVAGDGVVGFFPSDQLVADPRAFRQVVRRAIGLARRQAKIVTIGIRPDYPATCFGYILPKTARFVEKPDSRRARAYVRQGGLWNAGLFIAQAKVFRAAFAAYAPQLVPLAAGTMRPTKAVYAELPKVSFDYAVMEHAANIAVFPGDFGWDDVGSFAAFDRYFPHDSRGNVREGPCTVAEADGNICVARSARISLLGVKNLVVVTTPNAVLVAEKSRLSEMKKLFR